MNKPLARPVPLFPLLLNQLQQEEKKKGKMQIMEERRKNLMTSGVK